MVTIQPFRAWRPRPDLVSRVICPPYDVVNTQEARALARGNPISFLHVVRSEIDLPEGADPYAPEVYEGAARNLKRLIEEGILFREETSSFYVYQQKLGEHVQAGLVMGASAEEYRQGLIKKHEQTRAAKERDRTTHIQVTGSNTGPVFLCYQRSEEIDQIVDSVRSGAPLYDVTTPDGVVHTLWQVSGQENLGELKAAFGRVGALYIADGHHRAASSVAVCKTRQEADPGGTGQEPWNFFLAVAFPHNQLKIMGYHRIVRDLHGLDPAGFRQRLAGKFELVPGGPADPKAAGRFGMFLEGSWWGLEARPGLIDQVDPVASLDCSVLQEQVFGPLLGIADPRTDDRIDFVGGIRGTGELERRCKEEGWAVAFALHPTSVAQLMAVADAGRMMPPKSTWFEPKLRSGLVVRSLDSD